MSEPTCWQVSLTATAGTFKAFEAALESYCEAVTCFPVSDESIWQVTGFTRTEPDRPQVTATLAAVSATVKIPAPAIKIAPVAERDWEIESFSSFPPVRVGRYFIYGSHETEPVPSGTIDLCLDAGPAFGTGRHASTSTVLWALDDLAGRRRFPRHSRVLDMGTGSGILAMVVAKTWHVPVVASDIDPRAVETCIRNIRLNGVRQWITAVCSRGYRAPVIRNQAPYDLIICNILADPICQMAGNLARSLAPGGLAMLSGFLEKDWRRVCAAHRVRGLQFVRRYEIDGWQNVIMKRKS